MIKMLKLKLLRKRSGMSGKEVAEKLGISIGYYYDLEKGRRKLNANLLQKICEVFNISPDYFEENIEEKIGNMIAYKVSSFKLIPILGKISAGGGIMAQENIIGYQLVEADKVKDGDYFYLVAEGDSMINARIQDGDLLLVRKQDVVENGEIAVVLIDKEMATVKRVYFKNGIVFLHPENPRYKTQVYNPDEIRIIGKVVEVTFKL